MIKDSQKTLNRIHVLTDALFVALSYLLAYYLRFQVPLRFSFLQLGEDEKHYSLPVYARYLYFIIPIYMILYYICGLYKQKRGVGRRQEYFSLLKANSFGIVIFVFLLYTIKDFDIARWFLIIFLLLNFIMDAVFRMILSAVLNVLREKGYNQKHILIVGYSRAAEGYIDRINSNPHWGYHIHGILDNTMEEGTLYKRIPVIGGIDCLEEVIADNDFDEIAVALSIDEYGKLEDVVKICEKSGVHTKLVPDYNSIIPTLPYIEDMLGLPVINIRKVPLSNVFNKEVKRIVDVIGTLCAIIIFSIPMIITAIIIKVTSKGPIIYSQVRIGLHNKEFRMYKFRSMRMQTESEERKGWTKRDDPRVTRIGRFIRKTSIDELPQLFNVLCGNMSLVGPRPERPQFVEKFKEEIPRYMIKHQVRPGLTGWAQVNGLRGDTSIKKRIEHDLYYIENWTLGLDFKILFLTFFRGFISKNAY